MGDRICISVMMKSESGSCSVVSNSLQPQELYSPWNSPGQKNGVGPNINVNSRRESNTKYYGNSEGRYDSS